MITVTDWVRKAAEGQHIRASIGPMKTVKTCSQSDGCSHKISNVAVDVRNVRRQDLNADRVPHHVFGCVRPYETIGLPYDRCVAAESDLRIERVPAPIRKQVVEKLRQAIVSRQFKPGQRLVERELVELTGVSRTSIREALRELTAEGLVTSIPHQGNIVTTVSAHEAAEFYEVRTALETLAGRLFVENASDRQRHALRSAFGRLEKVSAGRRGDVVGPRDEFFALLLEGAGNRTLRTIVGGLQARSSVLRSLSLSVAGRGQEIVDELRAIIDAVDAGDADAAAEACRRYSERAARNGLAQLEEATTASPPG